MDSPQQKRGQVLSCPTCSTPFSIDATDAMPFCSTRCKQIDLGCWFDEEFGLPVEPELDAEDDYYGNSDISLN